MSGWYVYLVKDTGTCGDDESMQEMCDLLTERKQWRLRANCEQVDADIASGKAERLGLRLCLHFDLRRVVSFSQLPEGVATM